MAELKFPRKVRSDKEQKELLEAAQRLNKTRKGIGTQPTVLEGVKPEYGLLDFFTNYLTPPPVPPTPLIKTIPSAVERRIDKIKSKEKEEREKELFQLQNKSVTYQKLDYQHKIRTFWYTRVVVPAAIFVLSFVTLTVLLFDIKLEYTEAYLVNGLVGLGVSILVLVGYFAVRVWLNRKEA